MDNDKQDTIIIFSDSQSSPQLKGVISTRARIPNVINVDDLKTNIQKFLSSMDKVVQSSPEKIGKYSLDTIQINAEINGEGSVGLLGTGTKLGGSVGISFTLNKV